MESLSSKFVHVMKFSESPSPIGFKDEEKNDHSKIPSLAQSLNPSNQQVRIVIWCFLLILENTQTHKVPTSPWRNYRLSSSKSWKAVSSTHHPMLSWLVVFTTSNCFPISYQIQNSEDKLHFQISKRKVHLSDIEIKGEKVSKFASK